MTPAGERNCRLTIKALSTTDDAIGQPSGSETTIATVWGKRQQNRAREVFATGRELDEQIETFTVLYRSDITSKHVLYWQGVRHEIQNVLVTGNREELDLICRKVA